MKYMNKFICFFLLLPTFTYIFTSLPMNSSNAYAETQIIDGIILINTIDVKEKQYYVIKVYSVIGESATIESELSTTKQEEIDIPNEKTYDFLNKLKVKKLNGQNIELKDINQYIPIPAILKLQQKIGAKKKDGKIGNDTWKSFIDYMNNNNNNKSLIEINQKKYLIVNGLKNKSTSFSHEKDFIIHCYKDYISQIKKKAEYVDKELDLPPSTTKINGQSESKSKVNDQDKKSKVNETKIPEKNSEKNNAINVIDIDVALEKILKKYLNTKAIQQLVNRSSVSNADPITMKNKLGNNRIIANNMNEINNSIDRLFYICIIIFLLVMALFYLYYKQKITKEVMDKELSKQYDNLSKQYSDLKKLIKNKLLLYIGAQINPQLQDDLHDSTKTKSEKSELVLKEIVESVQSILPKDGIDGKPSIISNQDIYNNSSKSRLQSLSNQINNIKSQLNDYESKYKNMQQALETNIEKRAEENAVDNCRKEDATDLNVKTTKKVSRSKEDSLEWLSD